LKRGIIVTEAIVTDAESAEPRRHLHAVDTPPEGLNVGHVEANPETVGSTETPINPPDAPEPKLRRRAADLPPILPAWAASRAGLTSTFREAAKYYGHTGAHRGLRLVPDLLRWSWWGVVGAALVVARLTKWVADLDGHPLLGDVTAQIDRAYVVMADKRSARQKARAVAVVALIRYGKPADEPLLSGPTVPKAAAPRLTDVSISQAFGALGLPPLRELVVKGNTAALFAGPIERTRNGTGYRVEMTMPLGVTAVEIAACRAKLAGSLRRQIGQVWPLAQRGKHEAALELLVLDKPFSQMKLPAWPLLGSGKGDLLGPIPFGWSATGERITVTLFENNLLIGAAPGHGKSGAVLVVSCTGALDPRAELHLHELKGDQRSRSRTGSPPDRPAMRTWPA
jgi:S-DNA-T family DNA segregation ATPase FtsK/SpoIIIE